MVNEQLSDYIKQQLQQKKSKEEIEKELLGVGWQKADISQALGEHDTTQPFSEPKLAADNAGFVFVGLLFFFLILYFISMFVFAEACDLSYYDSLQNYRCPFKHGAFYLPILAAILFSLSMVLAFSHKKTKAALAVTVALFSYIFFYITAVFLLQPSHPSRGNIFGEDLEPLGTLIMLPFFGLIIVLIIVLIVVSRNLNPSIRRFISYLARPAVSVTATAVFISMWFWAYIYAASVESNFQKLQKVEQENLCQFVKDLDVNLRPNFTSRELILSGGKTQGSFNFEATRSGRYTFSLTIAALTTERNSYYTSISPHTTIERDLTIGNHLIPFEMSLIESIPDQIARFFYINVGYNLQESDLQEFPKIHPDVFDQYGYRGNFDSEKIRRCFSDNKQLSPLSDVLELRTTIEGVSIINQ